MRETGGVKRFVSGLQTPVQYLKGVGPKRAACLKKIGVETVEDLLLLVPHRFLDLSQFLKIRELKPDVQATISGRVIAAGVKKTRLKGDIVRIYVQDETGLVEAVWFNRPDLKKRFKAGQKIMISGTVSFYDKKQFVNPNYEIIDEPEKPATSNQPSKTNQRFFAGTVVPVYPLTEGLSLWEVRRIMEPAVGKYRFYLQETLPKAILEKYGYHSFQETIKNLHFPQTIQDGLKNRERLIFDELFYFELLLALRKANTENIKKGFTLSEKGVLTTQFLKSLHFELTNAQKRVLAEIKNDMAQAKPMNRLLEGDVGSGKTVIAIYAMLIAVENGFQAALMAPTEILAEQHFLVWNHRLKSLAIETRLLTGSTKDSEKREIIKGVETGKIPIIIGTHALIEEAVKFSALGLAIVDEQHRFGVMQRAALLNKGINPDFLVMTATPIPRTLALTLYGDLDISILDEKPPGREPIQTDLFHEKERYIVYQFIKDKISQGEQAFIVCPLIEESEKLDIAAAKKTFENVSRDFGNFQVGLLHGRMKSSERIRVMEEFRQGKIDILVTTTVIEVGVDIPRATIMVIEHPERFGLAQLHQLRGRVGRGSKAAYCILILPDWVTEEIKERLNFFKNNDDGFQLAEKDFEIRGPGQIFGTRQHGLPDLKIADLQEDRHLLFRARDEAFEILQKDPKLTLPESQILLRTLKRRFAAREELLRVG